MAVTQPEASSITSGNDAAAPFTTTETAHVTVVLVQKLHSSVLRFGFTLCLFITVTYCG